MTVSSTWSKAALMSAQFDLRVLIPHAWSNYGVCESQVEMPSCFKSQHCVFSGKNHFHFYPKIMSEIIAFAPDVIHIDEEPYSLVTFQVAYCARKLRIPYVIFSWQNIYKRYPWPFGDMEAYVLRHAAGFIGGNAESISVFRRKGYSGVSKLIPQFGVRAANVDVLSRKHVTGLLSVGFLGRFVDEKGIETVLQALVDVKHIDFHLVGSGPAVQKWSQLAEKLGIAERVQFLPPVGSTEIWPLLRSWDVLVLPSVTRANWKEQFGRVLIEAMAVGTCVLGSSSGEIPNVIGNAGLVFAEGESADCARQLRQLEDPQLRTLLASRGLERVRQNYTQEKIVEQTLAFYKQVLSTPKEPLQCCV